MKTIKIIILLICIFFYNNVKAQLTVSSSGAAQINANIPDWASALRCVVPTANGCAYHLTYAGSDVFFVCANGSVYAKSGFYTFSDIKYKENINKIQSPLSLVLKLNGVQYNYKGNVNPKGQRLGFIAQDIEKILPGIVTTTSDSSKAISYSDITPLLVEAIKAQQLQIDSLKQLIAKKSSSGNLKSASINTSIENPELNAIDIATLNQNTPNPFSQSTIISYYLPATVQNATLYIYDMNGVQIKSIPVTSKGNGTITINGYELRPGMYLYTLIVDRKEIDTKRMILTE